MASTIDEPLSNAGFVRRKATWSREREDLVDLVEVQVSKGRDAFTIDLGVFDPRIYRAVWSETPAPLRSADAIVRIRLGELLTGRDTWWRIDDQTSGHLAADALVSHGLAFFEQIHSHEEMERFLAERHVTARGYIPSILYLALLKARVGKPAEACDVLRELRLRELGNWGPKIEAVFSYLNCD